MTPVMLIYTAQTAIHEEIREYLNSIPNPFRFIENDNEIFELTDEQTSGLLLIDINFVTDKLINSLTIPYILLLLDSDTYDYEELISINRYGCYVKGCGELMFKSVMTTAFELFKNKMAQGNPISSSEKPINKFYKELFEKSCDNLIVLKNDTIIDCSDNLLEFYHIDKKDHIIGKSPWDYSPEYQSDGQKSKEKGRRIIQDLRDNEYGDFLWTSKSEDNKSFDCEISVKKLIIENNEYLISSHRDISERIRRFQILEQSEKWYKAIFDEIDEVCFIFEKGVIFQCNQKMIQMYKAENKDDIIGKTIFDLSPEYQPDGTNSKKQATNHMQMALSGREVNFYWKHKKLDGTLFDAEVSLSKVTIDNHDFLLALNRDITNRMNLV
jgi:PAS domain S-box-containing protein